MSEKPDVEYVPLTRADVADDNAQMLANSLRALQSEVRSGFDLLGNRILEELKRIHATLDDHASRLRSVERTQSSHGDRLARLEAAALAPRPIPVTRRPARQKAK